MQGHRLAEHEAAYLGRALRIKPEVRQPRQQLREPRARLEPRQVDADAHVRALGEREVAAGVRARQVESIRVRENLPGRGWRR